MPQPKEEEAKVPDAGPALPDLDDLAAELSRLEAGGATGANSSGMPAGNVSVPTQPPVPDMNFGMGGDFNQMNPSMGIPQAQVPTYQP